MTSLTTGNPDDTDVTYFTYNADGIRISKEYHDDDVIYRWEYDLSGTTVIRTRYYIDGELTKILLFMYDENGSPFAMSVKDANSGTVKTYYYEKNLQGDIVGIMNEAGYKVVSYTYDAWGNPYSPVYAYHSGVSATDRANVELNPFRYRGYYYDSETGYYYLQTRYYNPEWGRFLNSDGYINANGDILGYNMFAYCSNNPISFNDPTGEGKVWDWLKEKVVDPAAEFIIDTIFESLDTAYPGNPINVLSIGVNVSGGCGLGGSLSFGVSIDREGNINPTVSVAVGGSAGCGASINISYSVSTATKNDALEAWGGNFGGSFAVPVYGPIGVGGGVDVSFGYDKYTNGPYFSVTFSEGVSVGPSPIEFHGQVNYTWVLPGFKVGE